MSRVGSWITVPASVRPLPCQEMLNEKGHPRVIRNTEATRGRDSVAFLGRASARTTIDNWHLCEPLR